MRTLVLDGSRQGDAAAARGLSALMEELARRGHEADALELRSMQIAPCTGCFGCWVRMPGLCVIDDAGREIGRRAARCGMLAVLTRLTFGGYSSELKKALDRLIPNISPFFAKVYGEVHHRLRYDAGPRLLAVGLAAAPDAEAEGIFRALVGRNAINVHSPAHAAAVIYDPQAPEAVAAAISAALDSAEAGA
jgi:multimeric flavodoxin WrbA